MTYTPEDFDNLIKVFSDKRASHIDLTEARREKIRFALAFTKKVLKKPSNGMIDEADGWGMAITDHGVKEYVLDVFNAMIQQAIKETTEEMV